MFIRLRITEFQENLIHTQKKKERKKQRKNRSALNVRIVWKILEVMLLRGNLFFFYKKIGGIFLLHFSNCYQANGLKINRSILREHVFRNSQKEGERNRDRRIDKQEESELAGTIVSGEIGY